MVRRIKDLFAIKGYSLFVICLLFVGIGLSITTPYLSLYSTKYIGMSSGAFGIFMAVISLSGVLVNTFIAERSDRGIDRKWLIMIAMISSAIGYASYLIFHNYYLLLVFVALFNGLGAAAMPQIFASAQESANASLSKDKTLALSTLRSLVSLGFLIGPLVGTLILRAKGYHGLFWGTSSIYIMITLLVFFFLEKRKPVQNNIKKKNKTKVTSAKRKQLRLPFIAFILLFAVSSINWINTPLFIVNELHGTNTDVGLVVSLCAGLEIPIMLVLGVLSKKISNHALMIYGCFIGLLYYLILSISTHTWELIIAQLLQATYIAIVMGNGISYFNDLLPNSPGFSASIYANCSTIGSLVGNLGGGLFAQLAGFRNVYLLCILFVICSLIILWKSKNNVEMEISTTQSQSV
ncbi:sugar efflux transporter [Gottfriedia acidiceleris]|uniref:sugar efflux transporter n=1 Tax=Gottfriedia acidiceleris TaxID=371036 RepID=UPI00101DE3CD|nr:sugar efflux transporter [Gottfriedia acidiceleris]